MHALKPSAIRVRAGKSQRFVCGTLRINRQTLRAYEQHPDLVKTPALRALLDRYYARLVADVLATEADERAYRDGSLLDDEEPPSSTPWLQAA